jgi:hypothetical protein
MHSETGISARKSINFLAINEKSSHLPNFPPYEYSPHCILNLRNYAPMSNAGKSSHPLSAAFLQLISMECGITAKE